LRDRRQVENLTMSFLAKKLIDWCSNRFRVREHTGEGYAIEVLEPRVLLSGDGLFPVMEEALDLLSAQEVVMLDQAEAHQSSEAKDGLFATRESKDAAPAETHQVSSTEDNLEPSLREKSADFDGSQSRGGIGINSDPALKLTSEGTWEMWLKLDQDYAEGVDVPSVLLFHLYDFDAGDSRYGLELAPENGQLTFTTGQDSSSTHANVMADNGVWNHIAVIKDGAQVLELALMGILGKAPT
jgi:hypothetical protein